MAGVIGTSMVFTHLLTYALAVTAIFWALRWIGSGSPSIRTPIDWPVIILVLMTAISFWATALPETTYPQVYRLLLGIGFFYAIINWTNTKTKLQILILALSLIGLSLAMVGLFSVQWTTTKVPFMPDWIYDFIPTLVSDIIHRNVMAGTLVVIIPIIIAIPLFDWQDLRGFEKFILIASSSVMIGVVILTQSRAGWMALALSMGVLVLLAGKWTKYLFVFAATLGIVIMIYVGITPFLNALIESNTIGGFEGRLETWSRAIYMIRDYPFTGVGMGSFMMVADTLYPFTRLGYGTVHHAHNMFMQVAVDLGIPGFISWFAILIIVCALAWQLYRKGRISQNRILSGFGAGFFCSQIAFFAHGILDSVTWGMVRPAPIIWGIWGLSMGGSLLYLIDYQNIRNKNSLEEAYGR